MLKTKLDDYNFLFLFQELDRLIKAYHSECNKYVDTHARLDLLSDGSGGIIWEYKDGDWFKSWDIEFNNLVPIMRTAINDVKEMINEAHNRNL
jgi:hypothetical protein